MSKVYLAFHSVTGNTEEIANLFAQYLQGADYETEVVPFGEADVDELVNSDKVALGCPACGTEELDEEFLEFFDEIKERLSGKKVALFGSFGWGDGEYQEEWETSAKDAGIDVYGAFSQLEGIDDEGEERLKEFAEGFAKA